MIEKFTKLMLSLALLVAGAVGDANAKTLNVDLSSLPESEGNATWDKSTNTFAWTGTWSNALTLPGVLSNMSEYTTVNWTATKGTCDHFRVLIYYSNGTAQTTYNPGGDMTGTKSVTFAEMGVVAANLAYISSIKISGASDTNGDIIISAFSFTGPDVVPIEATEIFKAPAGTTNMQDLTGTYPTEGANTWKAKTAYPKELACQGDAFGNGDGSSESTHMDISAYDYLSLVVTEAVENSVALRVWIWDGTGVVTLYAQPEANYATADYTQEHRISAPGVYVVKVSGYNHLKGIKAANNWGAPSVTVSYAYLSAGAAPVAYQSTGEYTIVGKDNTGSASVTAALADANAVYFDATGVTGTGIDFSGVANPNALFLANAGTLSNAKNVIVNGTCANLVLTDEKPFRAPAAFTATAASLSKTVTDAGYATLVLPFAADIPTGVEAFNIKGEKDGVLTTGKVVEIAANKPVMLKNAGTFAFTASGVSVAATPSGTQQNGLLYGVYESTDVPTATGYVLQKQAGGVNFYKAATGTKVNALRAYLATAGAGSRLTFDFGTTGLTSASRQAETATEVYNLKGQRVAQPKKGLYVVNGKKMMVK